MLLAGVPLRGVGDPGRGSPHGPLEKPLGPGGMERCGRRTLYVPIINPLALTVYVGLFAFQGLRPGGWERGEIVAAENI